jgi:hypothetical protein
LLIRSSISFSTEGLSKVPRICRRVVLPAPEAPTIDTISPCLYANLLLLKHGVGRIFVQIFSVNHRKKFLQRNKDLNEY